MSALKRLSTAREVRDEFQNILADAKRALATVSAEEARKYVVFTGDQRIWRNEVDCKAGRWSISLGHATRFLTYAGARGFAVTIRDGNGARGECCTVLEALEYEVAMTKTVIASFPELLG